MSTIYRSPKAHVFSDVAGLVETIVSEHAELTIDDQREVAKAVQSLGQGQGQEI